METKFHTRKELEMLKYDNALCLAFSGKGEKATRSVSKETCFWKYSLQLKAN